MGDRNGFEMTTRDRVLDAWENSTELVRDFETYSKQIDDDEKIAKLFAEFAKDEGVHASKFLEILQGYEE